MTARLLINVVGFQIGWFACVLGASAGYPWLGPLAVLLIVLPQLWTSGGRVRRATTLAGAALLGYAADSTMVLAGVIDFPPPAALGGPAPIWMVAMWVNFAATLNDSLGWLASRYGLATVLGLVGGPLAYVAGQRLGAITFRADDPTALIMIAIEWAIATPLLLLLAHRSSAGAVAVTRDAPEEAPL